MLFAVSLETGQLLWDHSWSSDRYHTIVTHDGIYVATSGDSEQPSELVAIDPHGTVRWRVPRPTSAVRAAYSGAQRLYLAYPDTDEVCAYATQDGEALHCFSGLLLARALEVRIVGVGPRGLLLTSASGLEEETGPDSFRVVSNDTSSDVWTVSRAGRIARARGSQVSLGEDSETQFRSDDDVRALTFRDDAALFVKTTSSLSLWSLDPVHRKWKVSARFQPRYLLGSSVPYFALHDERWCAVSLEGDLACLPKLRSRDMRYLGMVGRGDVLANWLQPSTGDAPAYVLERWSVANRQ